MRDAKDARSTKSTPGSRSASGTKSTAGTRTAGSGTRSSAGTRTTTGQKSTMQARSATGQKNSAGVKKTSASRNAESTRSTRKYEEHLKLIPEKDDNIRDEIGLVIALLVCVLLFLSSLKLCGSFGNIVNTVVFGLFGSFAYAFPFVLFAVVLFAISNKRNASIVAKTIYCFLIMIDISAIVQLFAGGFDENIGFADYFSHSQPGYEGIGRTFGGLLGGGTCKILCPFLGNIGAGCVMFAALIILLILILGKAILTAITHRSVDGINNIREKNRIRREEREAEKEREEELALEAELAGQDSDEYYDDEYDGYDIPEASDEFEGTENSDRAEYERNRKNRIRQLKQAADRRKKKAGEGFIDKLMRIGMGLDNDISRISETPEYQELKESYGMSDYEMGELITDVMHANEQEKMDGRQPGELSRDIVQRELDKKFGDSGKVQVVNLREHSKVIKENTGYFVDKDPDSDEDTGFEELGEDLKKQVAGFYDDEPKDSKTATPASNAIKSEGSGEEKDTKQNDTPEGKNNTQRSSNTRKDREASGATGFNSADQIREEMERVESIKQNPPYVFPPISLLKEGGKHKATDQNELKEMVDKLQSTLESFGVHVRVGDATCGPTVTRYEIYPDQGVKVKTITALSDDIKLALAVPDIRIEAPIPGKAAVGIEVPNKTTTPVSLRELIDSDTFKNMNSRLTIAVGKDIGGKIICSDIADMPHALVAGSTGSGKSVCINAMILSILYKAKPSEVKLILIDPKRVELVGYNGIPHLLVPVVTDVKKATGALNWAVAEMDDRYNRFADAGVSNLAAYNRLMEEKYYEEGGTAEECPDKLPQILIIIDEFCDLMMTGNAKEVEAAVGRLTQLARACGIHLVIATQRPAVTVITGTIKANIPSRISFSLTSVVDSRTILDQAGAEKLLGKGDMLFLPQGYPQPVRLQGAYVSDKEIAAVVGFVKENCKEAMYSELVSSHIDRIAAGDGKNGNSTDTSKSGSAPENDRDELFEEAGRLIIQAKKASIGAIQRKFRVGFNRAARIMDQLAEEGVVGPDEGTKPRSIFMTMEQFEAYLAGDEPEDDPREAPGAGNSGE